MTKSVFIFTIHIGMLHMSNGLQRTEHFSWDKVERNAYSILGEKALGADIGKLRRIREW